jgi:CHAD domain-containing protein
MMTGQALAVISAECLDQVIRNAAVLADVDTAQALLTDLSTAHLHQLRVGVHRLRSAWKLFTGLAVLPTLAMQEDLKRHFGNFGVNRDCDIQDATVLPLLREAGMPALPPQTARGKDDSAKLARAKPFQLLLLELLEWIVTPQPAQVAPTIAGLISAPDATGLAFSEALLPAARLRA